MAKLLNVSVKVKLNEIELLAEIFKPRNLKIIFEPIQRFTAFMNHSYKTRAAALPRAKRVLSKAFRAESTLSVQNNLKILFKLGADDSKGAEIGRKFGAKGRPSLYMWKVEFGTQPPSAFGAFFDKALTTAYPKMPEVKDQIFVPYSVGKFYDSSIAYWIKPKRSLPSKILWRTYEKGQRFIGRQQENKFLRWAGLSKPGRPRYILRTIQSSLLPKFRRSFERQYKNLEAKHGIR